MNRSRAAFLPFPGDPFLLHYWLRQFDSVWGDEVDVLYVYHNSTAEPDVAAYIEQECLKRPKIRFMYSPVQQEHGKVLDLILEVCTEEYVMLIEDDCFIFKKGFIDRSFKAIESGEKVMVGSKRGSCSIEILTRAEQLWGLSYQGEGDQGCNFWPNLFFTRADVLRATDHNFGAKSWLQGQEIDCLSTPESKYLAQGEVVVGDTFVDASLQLRKSHTEAQIGYIPQYHGSPEDLDHYDQHRYLFDGSAPWVHVGSLSSGVGGVLIDEDGRSLIRRTVDLPKGSDRLPSYVNSDGEKREFERRVQWWLTFYEQRDSRQIVAFAELYKEAIDRVIDQYNLNITSIRMRQEAYRTLGLP